MGSRDAFLLSAVASEIERGRGERERDLRGISKVTCLYIYMYICIGDDYGQLRGSHVR